MERAAYELAEDKAKEGVIYFEARYSPHLLSNTLTSNPLYAPEGPYKAKGDVSPSDVVAAISKGLARGQKDFGVKARQILCTLRGCQEYSESILQLAVDHASNGVVGIDMAGSVSSAAESIDPADQLLFKKAAELGIHRTVHAGESGSAGDVLAAIEVLGAERIGHGYHAVDDPAVWKLVLEKQIHLEACPISSLKTGSVADWASHPLKKYVTDKASFSISTDDPLIFGNDTNLELEMLQKHLGFEHLQLWICVISLFLSQITNSLPIFSKSARPRRHSSRRQSEQNLWNKLWTRTQFFSSRNPVFVRVSKL